MRRYVAHEAKAEKTGAVNTQTVSTDRGMFKEFKILPIKFQLITSIFARGPETREEGGLIIA